MNLHIKVKKKIGVAEILLSISPISAHPSPQSSRHHLLGLDVWMCLPSSLCGGHMPAPKALATLKFVDSLSHLWALKVDQKWWTLTLSKVRNSKFFWRQNLWHNLSIIEYIWRVSNCTNDWIIQDLGWSSAEFESKCQGNWHQKCFSVKNYQVNKFKIWLNYQYKIVTN